ncbi:TPA_asm: hypothetical protein G1455_23205 [Salmonella enterica]|uniref:Uncharacterized protein n=1 Tax=Salmonella enterica TaxID=28901 RepID=A0A723DFK6_SALER|nr:hypothetical protein [Salmonella enterica]
MSNVECPPEFRAATSIGFTFFRPTLSCWFAAASSPGRNTLHFVPVAITGIRGRFGKRKFLYYKGFPGMSTPVFMVSVCSSVKIKGRDCGTISGHFESSSIQALMKDAREVLVR